jgi:uroporphyrinogen decarboxylase
VDPQGVRSRLDVPFSDQLAPLWEAGDPPTSAAEVRARMPVTSAEALRASGLHVLTEQLLEQTGGTHALYGSCSAPYPAVYNLLGFSGLMFAMREQPELVTVAAECSLAATVTYAEAARAAGLEVMFVEEWACSADLISPQDYAQFAWPFERDLCRELTRLGFATVFYFCGSIEDRLDKLAQLDVSALAFEESKKGFRIDLRAVRKAIGPERCLFGNLDVTLVRDLPAGPLLRVVDDLIRAAGPQAFVTSVGSPLTLDTPPAKVDLLMEAARSHG